MPEFLNGLIQAVTEFFMALILKRESNDSKILSKYLRGTNCKTPGKAYGVLDLRLLRK
jgi:hypothetical protein